MLREIGPGIAVAEVPFKLAGINFGLRMTVIKLSTGELLLHSPVAFSAELQAAVDGFGKVAHIVAPNSVHHLFAKPWLTAYPNAKFYCVPELPPKRPDLPKAILLNVGTPSPWGAEVEMAVLRASKFYVEAVFFHVASGTLITTDLVFNIRDEQRWADRVAFKLYGCYGHFGPTRTTKLLIRDRSHARAVIDRIAQWPIKRVTMAHGKVFDPATSSDWRAVFAWL